MLSISTCSVATSIVLPDITNALTRLTQPPGAPGAGRV
jgi:hypothetical protein